jgi:hypothetical protein
MKLRTSTKKKHTKRRRVPSSSVHTTDSFSLHFEDLHSAKRFKPLHFMFLSIAFLVIAGAFSIALITRHNSEASAEQPQVVEVK